MVGEKLRKIIAVEGENYIPEKPQPKILQEKNTKNIIGPLILILLGFGIILTFLPTGEFFFLFTNFGELESIFLFVGTLMILLGLNKIFKLFNLDELNMLGQPRQK